VKLENAAVSMVNAATVVSRLAASSLIPAMRCVLTFSVPYRWQIARLWSGRLLACVWRSVGGERAWLLGPGPAASPDDLAEAFTRLRTYARNHNLRLTDVAQAAIDGSYDPSAWAPQPARPTPGSTSS
jgi:hypothetical protein